jgi:hypothetical protein
LFAPFTKIAIAPFVIAVDGLGYSVVGFSRPVASSLLIADLMLVLSSEETAVANAGRYESGGAHLY